MKVGKFLKSAILTGAFVSAATLYSCGGGGGGGSSSTPTAGGHVTGNAIDGYLFASTVFVDCNGNGRIDKGEPSGFTYGDPTADDSSHIFELDSDPTTVENYILPEPNRSCENKTLYTLGGYDTSTNLTFGGVLIGKVGKYNNNVTVVTSIIEAADNPEAVKNKIENVLGLADIGKDAGINYMEEETTPDFLRFTVALSAVMQSVSQILGQLDTDTAKSIYKNIGNRIAAIGTSEVPSPDLLIDAIVEGTITGLKAVDNDHSEFDIDNDAGLKDALQGVVDSVKYAIDNDMNSYEDLGKYADNDSIIYDIHNLITDVPTTVDGAVKVGRLDIDQITVSADNETTADISENGNFVVNVAYTDNDSSYGNLNVTVHVNPENGDMICNSSSGCQKDVSVVIGIQDTPLSVSKRSAIIRIHGIKLDIDNDGNITGLSIDEDGKIIVDGTDSTGNHASQVYLSNTLVNINDILYLDGENEITIDVDKLLTEISNNVPASHPLKYVQLDNHSYRTSLTIQGIPSRPIEGNLNLE